MLEFKSDGTFVRSWGEGSTMFIGAHSVRFDPQGNLWYVDAADDIIYRFDSEGRTVGTLGTNPEPWTYLTHVIEHAAHGKAAFYQETDIGWSKDGSMFVSDGYGNSRVAKFDKDGNFVKSGASAAPSRAISTRRTVSWWTITTSSTLPTAATAAFRFSIRKAIAKRFGTCRPRPGRSASRTDPNQVYVCGQRGPSLQNGSHRQNPGSIRPPRPYAGHHRLRSRNRVSR